ncbi:MFS transporter SP family solute carrier family 2 (myo-inositol transporter) member 13 [Microdochium nivale]|nr:MFS transporter SP family solute carrier family 2 (myo-inositol transporter) member 13 [Microdochium nivale]
MVSHDNTQALQEGFYNRPLHLLDGLELYELVSEFHRDYLQNEVDHLTLQRGAYLAKDREAFMRHPMPDTSPDQQPTTDPANPGIAAPGAAHHIPMLRRSDRARTKVEDEALKNENQGALVSLTKDTILTLATCAIGALVQGWSQENIVGANNHWPRELEVAGRLEIYAAVNAISYFTASFCGVWLTDPLSSQLGRRGALFCSALCSFIAPIGAAGSNSWELLLAFRVIQGIGMGAKGAVIPVMMSEVSPPAMRGRILVGWQTFVALGILVGAVVNDSLSDKSWRVALGLSAVPAFTFLCFCYAIPESPRWLVENGEYAKAYQALTKLRTTKLQAAGELYLLYAYSRVYAIGNQPLTTAVVQEQLRNSHHVPKKSPYFDFLSRFFDLLRDDRNRRAALAACSVMAAQQMCGVNIFAFVVTTGQQSGAVITSIGKIWFAAINVAFSAAAYFLIDPLGRRTLLLVSLTLMLPPLVALAAHLGREGGRMGSLSCILVYAAVYSPGAGVIPFMYSSEVFGQRHRQVGMSLAVATNFSLAGVVTAVALVNTPAGVYLTNFIKAFAVLDGLAILVVWLFMRTPGARGNTLEDMHELFTQPLWQYTSYQIREVALKTLTRSKSGKRNFEQWLRDQGPAGMRSRNAAREYELAEAHA